LRYIVFIEGEFGGQSCFIIRLTLHSHDSDVVARGKGKTTASEHASWRAANPRLLKETYGQSRKQPENLNFMKDYIAR
jgi:hypothetical protein